jgi:excisionase family DNA binding protein
MLDATGLEQLRQIIREELRAAFPEAPGYQPYWNSHEVARFLGVSPHRVHELARREELPAYRVAGLYHFRAEEVRAWAASRGART